MLRNLTSLMLFCFMAVCWSATPLFAAGDIQLINGQKFNAAAADSGSNIAPVLFQRSKYSAPSLDVMIGQMLMVGVKGTDPKDPGVQAARKMLGTGKIGGLIFMGANMRSKSQIAKLIAYVKGSTPKNLPPLLGIDQEGGKVQRLTREHGFTDIPTAEWIGGQPLEKAYGTYARLARELSEIGININFGPVVDLNLVPSNPIIGLKGRSYGRDAEAVKKYAMAFVLAHRAQGILTSLKHFPGHGSSWTDSHIDFVDLSKSWRPDELLPYSMMLKEDLADAVMVGHLYHPRFSDTLRRPASLSKKAVTGVLRKEIGFNGLIITDDLGMGAVKKHFSLKMSLIHAVNAGNDILLLVNGDHDTKEGVAKLHEILSRAVNDGEIKREQLYAAYQRILKVKQGLARVRAQKK